MDPFEAITPAWISSVLKNSGYLPKGEVENFIVQDMTDVPFGAPKLKQLNLSYSQIADHSAPNHLILKIAPRQKEFIFYTQIAPRMGNIPFPICYHAEQSPDKSQAALLLEDLSPTHHQPEWPVPPTLEQFEQAIDCLAGIHAFWWNSPSIDSELYQSLKLANYWTGRLNEAIAKLPNFLDYIGDRLSEERKAVYEKVLGSSNQHWLPENTRQARTFLHGDIHFWNFLFPRDRNTHPIKIFDWNSWDIGKPTNDLAYMIGLHWYPSLKERFEKILLQRYHNRIREHGITNYAWDDLWLDYRHSTIMNLFIPVWQWQRGTPAIVWWPHLERSFLAFEDLQCAELL